MLLSSGQGCASSFIAWTTGGQNPVFLFVVVVLVFFNLPVTNTLFELNCPSDGWDCTLSISKQHYKDWDNRG